MMSILSSEQLHASCVAIDGRAVLITGPSGTGKSDLALRLIDRGALLVSDDYIVVKRDKDKLVAVAPSTIAGKIEVRGLGIIVLPHVANVPVALIVSLNNPVERMPERAQRTLAGIDVPVVAISAFESSAPIKVEHALREFGA